MIQRNEYLSKERLIWKNGAVLSESEATVSLYDEGAMRGSACFEMMRTFCGQTFRLDEHISRLRHGQKVLGYEAPGIGFAELANAHEELLDYHRRTFRDEPEWRTLIHVSRGALPIYEHLAQEPTVIITAYPLRWVQKGHSRDYERGLRAQYILSEWGAFAHVKHRSRLPLRMAEIEAEKREPGSVPILIREGRWVTESSGSNVFFVERGKLYTPAKHCLPGISRAFVIELAKGAGIEVVEGGYAIDWARGRSEVFFTNTPHCIVPVTTINRMKVGDGQPGPITKALTDAWIAEVGSDFIQTARSFDA